jgi:hypothetical protein
MDSPSTDIPNPPDDATALRALVLATLAERDAVATERDLLLAQNDRLRHLLLKLTRMQFGLPPWEWRVEIRASCNCTHSDCLHAGARLNWGAIADARVQALTIVEDFDVVEHRRLRLLAGVEADLVDVLRLE